VWQSAPGAAEKNRNNGAQLQSVTWTTGPKDVLENIMSSITCSAHTFVRSELFLDNPCEL